MFKHYLKIAARNTLANKGYSFINVLGLAIGIACCLLITIWIADELSYDKYHAESDRIYRVGISVSFGDTKYHAPRSNMPAPPAMVAEFPEVVEAVRIYPIPKTAVKVDDRVFVEEKAFAADSSLFDIFSFVMIRGDASEALVRPYSVVLTESTAHKYFGNVDPLGRVVTLDNEDQYTVTGVMQDVPRNSHFSFTMLTSISTFYAQYGERINIWPAFNNYAYLKLADHATAEQVEAKFPAFIDKYIGALLKEVNGSAEMFLQPLTDIHLNSHFEDEIEPNGHSLYVYVFGAVAGFVLLIACMNFINLTTARASSRAKEIGLRKTLGAARGGLVWQFLFESTLYAVAALLVALFIVELTLPSLGSVTGKDLSLSLTASPLLTLTVLILPLIIGIVAGSYPALYLSRFRPAGVLKGTWTSPGAKTRFRNVLVVAQFTIAIVLVIATLAAYQQVQYLSSKDLGFQKEQVAVIQSSTPMPESRVETVRLALASTPGVTDVAFSRSVPGEHTSTQSYIPEGWDSDNPIFMSGMEVEPEFMTTLGFELVAGRNFSRSFPTDSIEAAIVNEAAVRKFGWDINKAVGKTIKHQIYRNDALEWVDTRVIGVVKDFHFTSLHQTIEPLFIEFKSDDLRLTCIKIAPGDMTATLAGLESQWKEVMPARPFDFYFLDESLDSQYRAETRLGTLLLAFSILAIVTGCLGLFGLALYMAEQRTKEIGIRKALGASAGSIVGLLTREFVLLIAIASAVAWPVAYWLVDWWLSDFAYRVEPGWQLFVMSGGAALIIALVSVSYQAIRAARANPINSIRYE